MAGRRGFSFTHFRFLRPERKSSSRQFSFPRELEEWTHAMEHVDLSILRERLVCFARRTKQLCARLHFCSGDGARETAIALANTLMKSVLSRRRNGAASSGEIVLGTTIYILYTTILEDPMRYYCWTIIFGVTGSETLIYAWFDLAEIAIEIARESRCANCRIS